MNTKNFLSFCLLFLLPVSTHAMMLSAPRINARQTNALKYQQSISSARSSAPGSAETLVTVRSPATGISFTAPASWKVEYQTYGMRLSLSHSQDPKIWPGYIFVSRTAIPKKVSTTVLYRTFMEKSTIQSTSQDALGGDWYIPSFHLSSSGTLNIRGIEALSLRYSGEVASTPLVMHEIIFTTDHWRYAVKIRTLPQYAETDDTAFEQIVKTLSTGEEMRPVSSATASKKGSSSSSSKRSLRSAVRR